MWVPVLCNYRKRPCFIRCLIGILTFKTRVCQELCTRLQPCFHPYRDPFLIQMEPPNLTFGPQSEVMRRFP